MPRRTNKFQQLIAFIEKQLAPQGATVTESAPVQALDGTGPREVDVLIEGKVGDHPIRIGVECRAHRRRQSVTWIDQLDGTYRNLPINKVIAVSQSGFTALARERATRLGIETYSLDEALAADWPAEFTQWKAGLVVWHYYLAGARIVYASAQPPDLPEDQLKRAVVEAHDGAGRSTVEEDALKLYRDNGEQAVREAIPQHMEEWSKGGPGKEWDIFVPFVAHDRYLIGSDRAKCAIKEIILTLRCKYELVTRDHRHFTYRGVRVTTTEVPFDSHRMAKFTMLHGASGIPDKVNVMLAPLPRAPERGGTGKDA